MKPLSAEQIANINQFGQLDYTNRELAEIIGLNPDEFEIEAETPTTELYHLLRVVKLKADGEVYANLFNSAKTSVTAQQILQKHKRQREQRATKRKIDGKQDEDRPMPKNALKRAYNEAKEDYDALQELILKGVPTNKYTADMQEYWFRLKTAHDLFLNFENLAKGKPYVVNLLKARFEVSDATAYRYIHEAIDFFAMDLTPGQFKKVQYSKLEKVIALAWEMDKLDWLIAAIKEQDEILGLKREEQDKIPEEALQQKVIVITGDPKVLGVPSVSKDELLDFCKQLVKKGLTKEEGQRIANDAGVSDIEYEDIEDGN